MNESYNYPRGVVNNKKDGRGVLEGKIICICGWIGKESDLNIRDECPKCGFRVFVPNKAIYW